MRKLVLPINRGYDTNIDCLGLDVDGTITANPQYFLVLSKSVLSYGGKVVVITSRSEESRKDTTQELASYGLCYQSLHFLPSLSVGAETCPHTELDWFQRYLWHKVRVAQELGVTHFVDDENRVLDLFAKYAPDIRAITVNELIGCE